MRISKKIILTKDGTPTLAIDSLKETYHSRHGAIQESSYVYIEKGLSYWLAAHPESKTCNIFELGFGTGLNALLTAQHTQHYGCQILYESIENDPLPANTHADLGFCNLFHEMGSQETILDILSNHWDIPIALVTNFSLHKKEIDYFEWQGTQAYDVIYYDAFGSHAQNEMWEKPALERVIAKLNKGGVWVSYCAKGSVRRALAALGLKVERLAGPPGKREMLRAVKVE